MAKPEVTTETKPPEEKALGGAHEGSSRLSQEIGLWSPPLNSADGDVLPEKEILDARSRDLTRNDGYISGAHHIHRDSIVGSLFKLNAKPDLRALGINDDAWLKEFQEVAEAKFALFAESPEAWIDASGINTLTGLVRLAVGTYFSVGEVLATAEWIKDRDRPYRTAIQMVDPDRLSNPLGRQDDQFLRRGIERNLRGKPVAYWIRSVHPNEINGYKRTFEYKRIPARKPWGRRQVIHVLEQMRISQSRGIGDIVSALKEMKMTKKFKDITLQSAVVNATFAAAIESELPPAEAYAALGADSPNEWAADHLAGIAEYTGGSKNIHIDGVKIPHLYPGTKLSLLNAGQPGGVGTVFEESLLRHIAASLGLSYEQFSRDYTKTNYSSARASMGETWKFMQSRKKMVADRFASTIYALWLEEAWNAGELPRHPDVDFYRGQTKDALTRCTWIGASRGQIDELKETQAAILRIKSGLSTYEREISRLGEDFRDIFEQSARERKLMAEMGLDVALETNAKAATDKQQKDGNSDVED